MGGVALVVPGDGRSGMDFSVSWAIKPGSAQSSPSCWPQPLIPYTEIRPGPEHMAVDL